MAELNIVFRLRFAVAIAAAICLLLMAGTLSARAASQHTGEYIVQMQKGTTPAAGKRLVRALGGRVTSPTLRVINGFGAKLSRRAAKRLRHRRGVKAVSLNVGLSASATDTSGACPVTDEYGHGTHVAGLIAGNSLLYPPDQPAFGKYMGVAPRANLVSVKVSDDDGSTTVLDVIYGIQFAVDNKAAYNIRVINLSLSSATAESYKTDALDASVEQAWNSGITVVAAAGNEALTNDGVTFSPANDPWVITVGALDDKGTMTRLDDALAPWSSHGLTQDGVRKPEVLAPGVGLVSTLAPNSDFAHLCPACIVDGRYFRAGGTSMSTGVVSGAAALLIEAHPNWTPAQVKGALQATVVDVPGAGGVIDANAALDASSTATVNLAPNTLIDPTS